MSNILIHRPASAMLIDCPLLHDGIPALFFVLADAFCEHLKREDEAGREAVLHQYQVTGLCFASGIAQHDRLAMHEAANYILISLGFEPDPLVDRLHEIPGKADKERKREVAGHVYILTNPSLPGLVKIGRTCFPVAERVRQLSRSTSIPTPFVVAASFATGTPIAHESRIHAILNPHRKPGREFFAITEADAIATCKQVIGGMA